MDALFSRSTLGSALALIVLSASPLRAQETATPNDVADERTGAYALTGATVTVSPGNVLSDAVVLIREGEIVAVSAGDSPVPEGYATIDLSGRHIYPSLIDIDAAYGLPDPTKPAPFSFSKAEVLESETPGAYNPNQAIRAEYDAVSDFTVKAKDAATWRGMGFGTVLTSMADGIARGSAALVTLGDVSDNEAVLVPRVAAVYSFNKGSSSQSFPISPMGSVALLRQTFLDAKWYAAQSPKPFTDESLAAWLELQALPQIFTVDDWMAALRADMVGDEFSVQYVIREGGDAYQRVDAIKATGAALIVGLEFPDAEDVTDPFAADHVSLTDLKHWELAPSNAARLEAAGVTFALTSSGDAKKFWPRLRQAIERGLSEERALAALTTVPAALLGESLRLGELQPGAIANLIVTSAPLFDEAMVIEENWVAGERYQVKGHTPDRSGVYALSVGTTAYELHVSGKPTAPKAELRLPVEEAIAEDAEDAEEPKPITAKLTFDDGAITLSFSPEKDAAAIRLGGWELDDHWAGEGRLPDGAIVKWRAVRAANLPDAEEKGEGKSEGDEKPALGEVIYPFTAYGTANPPGPEALLIRNATVWTLEGEGKLEGADVLVRDGRIAAVGQNLAGRNARVIDAAGMHVTPGIIDEHSHIALSGVNDIATNSSMVRMNDVVNSEDVNIYRNLAGGVTAAQLLHGSANPVGGQSALVKMRWGMLPQEMLIDGADGFIKFALGENVKRSRNPASIRYPQTRMGVEQVFRDGFGAARDYQEAWAAWQGLSRAEKARSPAPRRDLVMDAMAEILDSERFISCHSYVQSEI
ncbi:MAG: amidohydrolase family protein, partial [Pseudomonadota bacterium]